MGMLDELLGGGLPAGLRDIVVERAEGNPFFVEEVLGTLIDLGLLTHVDGGWSLTDLPADFSVPDTVQAVVAARVDLLETADKQGLQAASVIGRIFWAGPVYELVDGGEPDLHAIEERDFIRRRAGSSIPGEREYAIKHAVTREVAYGSLPKANRAHMHAAFARWLERMGAGEEFASFLAHHYAEACRSEDADLAWAGREAELADLRAKAVAWLRQAGELAIGRMEIDDGLALLHRAIELEPGAEQRAALWHSVGMANILKYDGEAFWSAMLEALQGASDPAERAAIYADLAFQTSTRRGMWKTRPADDLVEEWIEQALELAEPASAARAKGLLARSFVEPEGSEGAAREVLEIADATGNLELRSFAMDAFAGASAARGDYEEGYEWCLKRIALVPEMTDPDHISLVYGYSMPSFEYAGRLEEAAGLAEAYDHVTRRLSAHHRLHAAFGFVEVEAATGRWDSVRDLTNRMEDAVEANVDTPCLLESLGLLWCALAHVHLGDDAEARRLEQVVEGLGKKGFEMRASIDLEIAIARGELGQAERILGAWDPDGLVDVEGLIARLDALVALGRRDDIEAEAPKLLIEGSYIEPFALRALGWARRDDEEIARAIERFIAMGMDWHAEQTHTWLTTA
jgi:hypothetical protein